jgi:hypothetical protein
LNRSESEYINNCRDCTWFDPAYDQCYFYGLVRADDKACMEFQNSDYNRRLIDECLFFQESRGFMPQKEIKSNRDEK